MPVGINIGTNCFYGAFTRECFIIAGCKKAGPTAAGGSYEDWRFSSQAQKGCT